MSSILESEITSLVKSFKHQIEVDRSIEPDTKMIYLPIHWPGHKVDYVFIGSEPSLGLWGPTLEEAQNKIDMNFKNFSWSMGDFVLHYAIREYLCANSGRSYYITDLSKGAMSIRDAGEKATDRYTQWLPLLIDEFKLFTKDTTVFISIGNVARNFLKRRYGRKKSKQEMSIEQIPHYSVMFKQIRWGKSIIGREDEFNKFQGTINEQDIINVANDFMEECGTHEQLKNRIKANIVSKFDDWYKKLLFDYKIAFHYINEKYHME